MVPDEPVVFIVDDDKAVRDALHALFRYAGYRVELYDNPSDFLELASPDRPGCLVLDIRMPVMSGLKLLEQLREHDFTLPVIVITGHGDVTMAVRAFKYGAVEFLRKPCDNAVLLDAVNQAIARDAKQRRDSAWHADMKQRLDSLTDCEWRILEGMLAGDLHKVIAFNLGMSLSTVDAHSHAIKNKLGARNRADLLHKVLSYDTGCGRRADTTGSQDERWWQQSAGGDQPHLP